MARLKTQIREAGAHESSFRVFCRYGLGRSRWRRPTLHSERERAASAVIFTLSTILFTHIDRTMILSAPLDILENFDFIESP